MKQLNGGKLKEVKAPKANKNINSIYNFLFNLILKLQIGI